MTKFERLSPDQKLLWLYEQLKCLYRDVQNTPPPVFNQDNKFKLINFGSASSPFDGPVSIADTINNLPSLFSSPNYKTVLEDEIPIFQGYVSRGRARGTFNTYVVKGYGKGIYGRFGNITLIDSDLILIEEQLVGGDIFPPIDNDPNAIVHDMGEISNGDYLTAINNLSNYSITEGTNHYYEFTVGGSRFVYIAEVPNGVYGILGTQMILTDLFLIYDESSSNVIITPTGLEALDEGNGIGWRLIGRNPMEYENIGKNAIDFSKNDLSFLSKVGGAGEDSVTFGQHNQNRGAGSIINGYNNIVSVDAYSWSSIVNGSNNINDGSLGGITSGSTLINRQAWGCSVFGVANKEIAGSGGNLAGSPTNPMFIIGNGTQTNDYQSGNFHGYKAVVRSNCFVARRGGQIEFESLSIPKINAGIDRIAITKEYLRQSTPIKSLKCSILVDPSGSASGVFFPGAGINNYGFTGNLPFSTLTGTVTIGSVDGEFVLGKTFITVTDGHITSLSVTNATFIINNLTASRVVHFTVEVFE